MSDQLAARVDAVTAVAVGLLAVHLAHDIRPDVTAQALLDAVLDSLSPEAATTCRQIVATALGISAEMRA